MSDMTLVEALAEAQNEIRSLKEKIILKDAQYHDLEMDNNFHVIKTAELSDILRARDSDDALLESLQVKADQNAELTVQVQDLRNHLNTSIQRTEQLDFDLKMATEKVTKLAAERKSHQKMLVEFSDVVRALGSISVEYEKVANTGSSWMSGESFENIKRKINAVEEDRQRRIEENEIFRSEIEARDERIDTLHKKALRLEAINENREKVEQENIVLKQECMARESKIEALEQLFITINNSRCGETTSIPTNVAYEQKQTESDDVNIETELKSTTDGSTEVVLSTTSVSKITEFADDSDDSSSDGESCSFSSLESPSKRKSETVRMELSMLKDKYNKLSVEHEETQKEVLDLQNQLQDANKRVTISKKKQDLREGLLREVIVQYKDLQSDHDQATNRISELEDKLRQSEGPSPKRRPTPKDGKSDPKKASSLEKTTVQHDEGHLQPIEEVSTFDLSEEASEMSSIHSNSSTPSTESEDRTGAAGQDSFSVHSVKYFDEGMVGEFNRLKSECARLEHEYDNAIAKIATLEEELKTVQGERDTATESQKECEQQLLESQHELSQLQQDYESVVDKSTTLEEGLKAAKRQTERARKTQKEREEDLMSVISQYKQVAEEKEEALSKMEGVERELFLTKKQSKRRDLIYDVKRLEQQYSDALANIKRMEQQLKRAQTDSTLSKEDAKSTRKRMAGCHFHFKKLQQEYNDILEDKAKVDRELTRVKNEIKRFKAQEECWTEKIVGIREKRKLAEEENKQLKEDNEQLKSYCNNLLVIAGQGMTEDDAVFADMTLDHLLSDSKPGNNSRKICSGL